MRRRFKNNSARHGCLALPEELQEYLDKQSSMNLVGDLKKYAQFQAADSIKDAAQNSGGLAGIGAGLGAGQMIGQAFGQVGSGGGSGEEDPFKTLEKLQALHEKGILTKEEFEAKKAEVLKRIS